MFLAWSHLHSINTLINDLINASRIVQGILIIGGVYLAFRTRKASSLYNESRYISLSIYTVAMLLVVCVPAVFSLGADPDVLFSLVVIALSPPAAPLLSTSGLLFCCAPFPLVLFARHKHLSRPFCPLNLFVLIAVHLHSSYGDGNRGHPVPGNDCSAPAKSWS